MDNKVTKEQYEAATKYVTENDDTAELWIKRDEEEVTVFNDDGAPYVRLDGCLTLPMLEALAIILKYRNQ